MRRLAVLALVQVMVLAGCAGGGRGGVASGAVDARQALDAFMKTVKDKDIQAMSLVWGTSNGPARDRLERADLEKRELLMQCYLRHDSYSVKGDSPGQGGRVIYKVEVVQGPKRRETSFTTIKGPDERWYVEDVDVSVMQDFCTGR
ncbi:MAG: hypothetical protein HYX65_09395 [Gemmatimonadetes bacterium]|nr:hypothetical protein [Gemmatimonadota bacterium]